jgi:hypothetical protein
MVRETHQLWQKLIKVRSTHHTRLWRSVSCAKNMHRPQARISHQTDTLHDSLPLLRRSSACSNYRPLLALRQAVAHFGEKCGLAAGLNGRYTFLRTALAQLTVGHGFLFGTATAF